MKKEKYKKKDLKSAFKAGEKHGYDEGQHDNFETWYKKFKKITY